MTKMEDATMKAPGGLSKVGVAPRSESAPETHSRMVYRDPGFELHERL